MNQSTQTNYSIMLILIKKKYYIASQINNNYSNTTRTAQHSPLNIFASVSAINSPNFKKLSHKRVKLKAMGEWKILSSGVDFLQQLPSIIKFKPVAKWQCQLRHAHTYFHFLC